MSIKEQLLERLTLQVLVYIREKCKTFSKSSPTNAGISFVRIDLPNKPSILANPDHIISTNLCTTIGKGDISVSTIEHLMAAFSSLGIDNAVVEVSAREIPILDGSSAPFVDAINEAGVQLQQAKRKVLSISKNIEIRNDKQSIIYKPWDDPDKKELSISASIDFTARAIGHQNFSFVFSNENFMKICEARTFCLRKDVESMRSMGLALGGSLDNAIVVDNDRILNNDGLRFENEFVKHKVLDFIGDLALLGHAIHGEVFIDKGGHALHVDFVKYIWSELCQQSVNYCTDDLSVSRKNREMFVKLVNE